MDISYETKSVSNSSDSDSNDDSDDYKRSEWLQDYYDSIDKQREDAIRKGEYYPDFD